MTVQRAQTRDRDVDRAWWSLMLFLPSLIAAFVTGEGLLAVMGHSDDQSPPVGTALMAGVPAMLVFAAPTLLVWFFGHRAERHGHREGRTPVVVAVVVAGAFIALNLVQLLLGLVA